ncbi:MAG: DNA mismatch repair protein MutS [Oscillospiraceae bacterium]|nr:DNA mismatch repair protein MutS [Oscillospiraceae bacterium]
MPADTPMMRQYNALKAKHPDCILFFRLGDFYEMFNDDAILASEELSITLTTRDRKAADEDKVPMCGVPFHSAEAYIARLIAAGHNVALCEQMEDPATAKGLVERDIVRIFTPGTLIEDNMLDQDRNNYIASVFLQESRAGVAFADISTGGLYATQVSGDDCQQSIITELGRYVPQEVLLCPQSADSTKLCTFLKKRLQCAVKLCSSEQYDKSLALELILSQWPNQNIAAMGLDDKPAALQAVGGLLAFIREMSCKDTPLHLSLKVYDSTHFMEIDLTAMQNLEICQTMRTGEKKGSLLWVLDDTKTPMGSRMLRSFLEKPLVVPGDITRRLYAVEALTKDALARSELRGVLKGFPDTERILTRIVFGTASCRDMRALVSALIRVPPLLNFLKIFTAPGLVDITKQADPVEQVSSAIDAALTDSPPATMKDGGFIREGYDPEVDRLRGLMTGAKNAFAQLEAREKVRTGIKSLKVGFNKVFGYYIEVSKSYYSQVPKEYTRKQTLASCERYVTQELKILETEIISAKEKLIALEEEIFIRLKNLAAEYSGKIQRTSQAVASLDALCAFAEVAVKNNYCLPTIDYSDILHIEEGRHPVVENTQKDILFVPNSTQLNKSAPTAIITGPNMAGKSTYMRQAALITLMAQSGSFVPAKSAHIGVIDRVFTRIGASDDLGGGRSTFMVEMTEVSDILRSATSRSLIILDEVGRGTSTFDGMSVAQAVLEFVHTKIGAKTLFATHYHELTAMENLLTGIRNYNISVKKQGHEIIFLRRIVPGGADDSYGVEVARLAGLPDPVISRARAILHDLEENIPVREPRGRKPATPEPIGQVSLGDIASQELVDELKRIDPDTLTPIEAMNRLYSLIKKAGKIGM